VETCRRLWRQWVDSRVVVEAGLLEVDGSMHVQHLRGHEGGQREGEGQAEENEGHGGCDDDVRGKKRRERLYHLPTQSR